MVFFLPALFLLAPPAVGPHRATPGPTFQQLSTKAGVAREANDLEAAVALYQRAVTRKPDWAEGWYYLATMQYDRDRFPEARDAFRKLLPLTPQDGVSWALLGMCEFRTKEYELALKHLAHGLQLGPGSSEQMIRVALYHYAMLLTHFGRFEEAVQQVNKLSRDVTDDPQVIAVTGLASLRMPLFPSEVPQKDQELVVAAGHAVFDTLARRPAQAQKEMEDLLARYPTTPGVHYIYGSYLMYENPERGLSELKKELEISPRHVPALAGIAIELLRTDQAEAAFPYARKLVDLDPKSFVTHNIYGRALIGVGEIKAGITELEYAVKLAPDSPQTVAVLASAYAKDGRKEEAAKAPPPSSCVSKHWWTGATLPSKRLTSWPRAVPDLPDARRFGAALESTQTSARPKPPCPADN